jgi:hypothetical protein
MHPAEALVRCIYTSTCRDLGSLILFALEISSFHKQNQSYSCFSCAPASYQLVLVSYHVSECIFWYICLSHRSSWRTLSSKELYVTKLLRNQSQELSTFYAVISFIRTRSGRGSHSCRSHNSGEWDSHVSLICRTEDHSWNLSLWSLCSSRMSTAKMFWSTDMSSWFSFQMRDSKFLQHQRQAQHQELTHPWEDFFHMGYDESGISTYVPGYISGKPLLSPDWQELNRAFNLNATRSINTFSQFLAYYSYFMIHR